MLSYASVADFLMTGCAVAPALALYLDQPGLAVFSHIILLLLGLLCAAGDCEAPCRTRQQDRNH